MGLIDGEYPYTCYHRVFSPARRFDANMYLRMRRVSITHARSSTVMHGDVGWMRSHISLQNGSASIYRRQVRFRLRRVRIRCTIGMRGLNI